MNILLTVAAVILIFGGVIFLHELGHFVTAKLSGIQVNEFALGMGPRLLHWQWGETSYAFRLLPIGGFVSMEGEDGESDNPRSFFRARAGNRMLVVAAGAVMNLLLGFVLLLAAVQCDEKITSRTVSGFYENAVTQSTGLEVGDTILSINGRNCYIADDILYEFARMEGDTVSMVVLRDGVQVTLPAVRFATTPSSSGGSQIKIDFTVFPIEKTPLTVTAQAGRWFLSYVRLIFLSLTDLLTGRVAVNSLSGPVGIVSTIATAVDYGLQPLLLLAALLTINLGVFNLLPLPALDGGHLVLYLVEAIARRRIPQKLEIVIQTVGFVLLMLLMIFATFNDVTRLITGG